MVNEQGKPAFRSFVVTGQAGVGKSTTIRAIAREFALRFRDRKAKLRLLPIVIPLQQVTVPKDWYLITEGERVDRFLWFLLSYWCSWAKILTNIEVVSIDWLRTWLRVNPSILILDGLDEFLINNTELDSDDIQGLLERFACTLQSGRNVRSHSAIVGIRNSYPGHRQLASQSRYVYSIHQLTNSQAATLYPHMKEVLRGISEINAYNVLLTPLILSWLGPRAKELRAESLLSKSVVMQYALDAIIEEGDVRSQLGTISAQFHESDVPNALALLGWLFYRDCEGAISISEVLQRVEELSSHWRHQFEGKRQRDGFLHAFELLRSEGASRVVLARTVFVSIGDDRWRFAHREWQDVLTASYVANIYLLANFDEMGQRAMTQAIFQMIGELLESSAESFAIEKDFATQILNAGGLAAVNLAGIVGNSTQLTVSPQAIKLLLSVETLDEMDKTARLVLITAVTYRALREAPGDTSVPDIRRALYDVCREYERAANDPRRNSVTSSLAWCYHRAVAATDSRFDAPKVDWPSPEFIPSHEAVVLEMLTAGKENGYRIEPRHRSLQVAWLEILPVGLTNPYRPVSVAHYLYALVVVYRHSAHIPEITRELPEVFRAESNFERTFREYVLVPELWTLFTRCRDAFNATISSSL